MSAAAAAPSVPTPSIAELADGLKRAGHVFLQGAAMQPLLQAERALDDWPAFVAAWDGMPLDTYMADGGRYRRRLYAVYQADARGIERAAREQEEQQHDRPVEPRMFAVRRGLVERHGGGKDHADRNRHPAIRKLVPRLLPSRR